MAGTYAQDREWCGMTAIRAMMAGALVALAVSGTGGISYASTSGSGPPSITARTSIGSESLPGLVQTQKWQATRTGWQTQLRIESPPQGHSDVSVRWQSPSFVLKHGQRFFETNEEYEQQGTPDATVELTDSFRICFDEQHTCTPWLVGKSPGPPQMLAYPPFIAFGSTGWGRSAWTGKTTRAHMQWRFAWHQSGADYAQVSLAVGI